MSYLARLSLGAAAAAAVLVVPAIASAQPFPDETIHGTVTAWTNNELMTVEDDRGFVDTISVGDQTEIASKDGRDELRPGTHIAVRGYNGGQWFDAQKITIDTGSVHRQAVAPAIEATPSPIVAPVPEEQPVQQNDNDITYSTNQPAYAPPPVPSYVIPGPVYAAPVYVAPVAVYPTYVIPAARPSYAFGAAVGVGFRGVYRAGGAAYRVGGAAYRVGGAAFGLRAGAAFRARFVAGAAMRGMRGGQGRWRR